MSITTIILGTVLVVLIIYMLFQSYFDGEQKLLNQAYLKDIADVTSIATPNASNFSYGIWIYLTQWISPADTEKQTRIFAREDELGLYLEQNGTLSVRFADVGGKKVIDEPSTNGEPIDNTTNYTRVILTNNFPLQKWVHIGMVVDGKKFDGYIDGKMVKSIELQNNITPNSTAVRNSTPFPIKFGKENSMNATLMIAEHKRRTYPMDPQGMWDLYMKGNGTNGLLQGASNMNVNLSILKDGVESSTFPLW